MEQLKKLRLMHTDAHIKDYGIPVKPGLLEVLNFLECKKIPMAVTTSSSYDRAVMKLRGAELHDRFSIIVSGDQVSDGKPAPDTYFLTARRLGVLHEQCLVLEDSDAGVRAAHAAGMKVILIPDLKPPAEDVVPIAFRIERSLTDVLHFLPELVQ